MESSKCMRSFRHWTPRYIKNRLVEMHYHKTCPDHPWLTKAANQILASYLKESDIGFEFGSGRSTVWFAKRTQHLTSIEHNEVWYRKVNQTLKASEQHNVDYHLIPKDVPDDNGGDAAYVRIIDRFEVNSLDYVLIDGVYRDFCALNVLEKIRPGGMMIIDNVNWFLPCESYSPSSRTFIQGPKGHTWDRVNQCVSEWRRIWTSSGVTDTALFFKPCD